MNDTPCTDCNFIAWRISCAYIARDWKDVRFWQEKRIEHQEACEVINSEWFKGLWPNAVVVPQIHAVGEKA